MWNHLKKQKIIFAWLTLLLIITIAMIIQISKVRSDPHGIIQTMNGPIEGILMTSMLDQKFYAYQGVPYAEPPIKSLRFKVPVPLKRNWTEPLKVHEVKESCASHILPFPGVKRSEDCLYLNVYVPVGGAAQKNVLVFINGGYCNSMLELEPDFFMAQDVILVHIHYRVGIYGFLNLDHAGITGNMGLKDQQLGMKWVYENIEKFSGKKDAILLFGHGKGGSLVHFHMLNEQSRKYYKRAFAIGGSALFAKPPSLLRQDNMYLMKDCTKIQDTNKLVKYLETESLSDIYNCLRSNNSEFWTPTIERPNAIQPFLTQEPEDIYKSDQKPIMDAMFAFTSEEALQFNSYLVNSFEPYIKKNWRDGVIYMPFEGFTKEDYPEEYAQVSDLLWKEYFENVTTPEQINQQNIAFISDMALRAGVLQSIMFQADANNNGPIKKNTFVYGFSAHTEMSPAALIANLTYKKATHSDDLYYMFICKRIDKNIYRKYFNQDTLVRSVIERLVKIVTNFARFGDPSIEGTTPFKSCKSSNEVFYTEISNDPISKVKDDIRKKFHYDTWAKIVDIYSEIAY